MTRRPKGLCACGAKSGKSADATRAKHGARRRQLRARPGTPSTLSGRGARRMLGAALIVAAALSVATGMAPTKRILALHGKGESSISFRQRIQPLLERIEPPLVVKFMDAPWELGNGGQWWKLPPGVRSYEAATYEGVDASLEMLANEFALGDVYGLIGFSQGAILLSFFLAGNLQLRHAGQPALVPRKALLIGGAWPKPYTEVMEALKETAGLALLGCEVLTVVGDDDKVNPPEMAKAVSACFGDAATLYTHAGKHVVPLDDMSLATMSTFLLAACEDEESCEISDGVSR